MGSLAQDLRYAARMMLKAPGFTLVAVVSLALGIGANTTIFTLLDRVLLRSLPVEQPQRLVRVILRRVDGSVGANLSWPFYADLRDRNEVMSGLLARSPIALNLSARPGARRVEAEEVSDNYFEVLGLRPYRGRFFTAEEGRAAGDSPVAVISHALWRDAYGGVEDPTGTPLLLNGRPFTVIGVAPEGFRGIASGRSAELWVPLTMHESLARRAGDLSNWRMSWLDVMGRLQPGVTLRQAEASLEVLDARIRQEDPQRAAERVALESGARGLTFLLDDLTRPLALLMTAVGLLLLIACANVANLLLARIASRRREIAIRQALGASRWRLVRQFLTEGLLLATAGGVAGLLLARWGTDLLSGLTSPTGASIVLDTSPDARVLGFTLAVAMLTGLSIGIAPALRAASSEPAPSLKSDAPGQVAGRRLNLQAALVIGQVAFSLVLLVGAALLTRSFLKLRSIDPGFETRDLLLASIDLEGHGYDAARAQAIYDDVLDRLGAVPGVVSASCATTVHPNPFGSRLSGVVLEGYTPSAGEEIAFDADMVGPGYYETLGIPLIQGRPIEERDRETSAPVAVINETMARRYWPDGTALGRRIRLGADAGAPALEIIGVAKAGRYRGLREAEDLMVWMPVAQRRPLQLTLLVRTAGDPMRLAGAVRSAIAAVDPDLPVFDMKTMRDHVATAFSQDRVAAALVDAFGVLALALASVGLYGVMTHLVRQRTPEIAIRVALGAPRSSVLRMILLDGMSLVGPGLGLGLAGALALSRAASGLLFEVSPLDPVSYAAVASALAAVTLLACWLPARRATKVDPMVALRCE